MLYGAEVAVYSEINTKQTNTVWAECQFLSFKPIGARRQGFKSFMFTLLMGIVKTP